MTTVRASCPECGDVELTTSDMRVVVCSTTNEGSYAFQCPSCRLAITKEAEARVIDVLVASGVRVHVWRMPAELDEVHSGPPISYDDLLAFHFDLQDDQWLDRLVAGHSASAPGARQRS